MQAVKVKGTIDASGHLVISEPIHLTPGEVEVILLKSSDLVELYRTDEPQVDLTGNRHITLVKAFQELFENAPPIPPDFNPEQAKWEYLKEKYDL
jgi:hypothetical protein